MVACARTFERFDSFDEFRKAPDVRLYPQISRWSRAGEPLTVAPAATSLHTSEPPPIFARDPIVK